MRISDNRRRYGKLKKMRNQEKVCQSFPHKTNRLENARKKSQGMVNFYRSMLEEEEAKHDAAVQAASKGVPSKGLKPPEEIEIETPREKKLADEARQINAKLGSEAVLINDEGEV